MTRVCDVDGIFPLDWILLALAHKVCKIKKMTTSKVAHLLPKATWHLELGIIGPDFLTRHRHVYLDNICNGEHATCRQMSGLLAYKLDTVMYSTCTHALYPHACSRHVAASHWVVIMHDTCQYCI